MNKRNLKLLSTFSLFFIVGCQSGISTSNNSTVSSRESSSISSEVIDSSTSSSSDDSINSSTISSTNTSSSSSVVSSSSSSSSSEKEYPVVEDEEKYIADEEKRVNVTINVTYPESTNDVYIVGDFNNWGKFNTLNDSSYKVNNGSISLSNIENGESYEYMFVQKIEGAIYTYNFNKSQVDSEGNQVIGYTKEGNLISQYCISQNDDKFSFVASEGGNFTSSVTTWKEAVYGTQIEVQDPNKTYDVPTSGYNLCISPAASPDKVYYIPLEARTDVDGEGRQQYAAYAVTLEEFDAFTIYDGNSNIGWAETNIEPYGAGNLFVPSSEIGVCALESGTYDIYVKLAYENNRIYIEKTGSSSGDDDNIGGSTEAPATGYALLVTPGNGGSQYYVALVQYGEQDYQGRDQYFGDNISLSAGDIFVLFNCSNQESWAEKNLEPYGLYENFTVTDEGIRCNVDGTYDIYAKFKWEDNTIYIGPAEG